MGNVSKYNRDREAINAHAHRMSRTRMAEAITEMFKTEMVANDEEARILGQIQDRILQDKYVGPTVVH